MVVDSSASTMAVFFQNHKTEMPTVILFITPFLRRPKCAEIDERVCRPRVGKVLYYISAVDQAA